MKCIAVVAGMSNPQLLAEVHRLTTNEREATVALLAALGELDARKLYLDQGCSSLFAYCHKVLGYSEDEAHARMRVARAARSFPLILEQLAEGSLTLTAARLLAPHLTEANHRSILDEAKGKSKERIEIIVARMNPRPDAGDMVRRVPHTTRLVANAMTITASFADERPVASLPCEVRCPTSDVNKATSNNALAETPAATMGPLNGGAVSFHTASGCRQRERAVVAPLSPDRYKVQMTISGETREKLKRAQALLRHAVPDGDLAVIFDRALTLLIAQAERTKHAATERPRHKKEDAKAEPNEYIKDAVVEVPKRPLTGNSRHIPAAVKREVWQRDGGRCSFVGVNGRRCDETAFLEYHHRVPYVAGGGATVENISLTCRCHNNHEGEKFEALLVGGPPEIG